MAGIKDIHMTLKTTLAACILALPLSFGGAVVAYADCPCFTAEFINKTTCTGLRDDRLGNISTLAIANGFSNSCVDWDLKKNPDVWERFMAMVSAQQAQAAPFTGLFVLFDPSDQTYGCAGYLTDIDDVKLSTNHAITFSQWLSCVKILHDLE